MTEEPKSTTFSLDPALSAWTNHLREHALMLDDHRLMHAEVAKTGEASTSAAWEAHMREHAAEQRAVDKVEAAVSARFESVNEFREQLREQARNFIGRNEFSQLQTQVSEFNTWRAQQVGTEKGAQPYTAVIFSVVSAVLSALAVGAVVIATRAP